MSTAATTATTTKRTTTVIIDGHRVGVGTGAVRQHGGTLDLCTCNTCGGEVVWAKSSRTGRSYLANVFRGQAGQRYYIAAQFHNCADRFARTVAGCSAEKLRTAIGRELDAIDCKADRIVRHTDAGSLEEMLFEEVADGCHPERVINWLMACDVVEVHLRTEALEKLGDRIVELRDWLDTLDRYSRR